MRLLAVLPNPIKRRTRGGRIVEEDKRRRRNPEVEEVYLTRVVLRTVSLKVLICGPND